EPSALTRNTTAAATPCPFAFAEKIAGATEAIVAAPRANRPSALATIIAASPLANPGGVRKLICLSETKKIGASSSLFALSLIVTVVPPSESGAGVVAATSIECARSEPKRATIDSQASVCALKLAADATATTPALDKRFLTS